MLLLQAIHQISIVYPLQYWGTELVLFLVVSRGWYVLGTWQPVAIVSAAPPLPVRRRVIFRRRNNAVLLCLGHLAIMGKLESNFDQLALTIALQVR